MSDTIYILGGGPSLFDNNLDLILKDYVIGVNDSIFLGDWVSVCWFGDKKWWKWHRDRLIKENRIIATCNQKLDSEKKYWWKYYKRGKAEGIETREKYVSWNKSSGASAINFAYHMGANRIVLLGFDMKRIDGMKNWHMAHKEKDHTPFARHLKPFPTIAKDAQNLGIEIINATEDSAIQSFPFATLDSLKKGTYVPQPPPKFKPKVEKREAKKLPVVPKKSVKQRINPKLQRDNSSLKFGICLKSGGDYYAPQAIAIANQLKRNVTIEHECICLTDTPISDNGLVSIPLIHKWPKSWALLELFTLTGPTVVFGLDTVVTGDLNQLGEIALNCPNDVIYMTRPRNKTQLMLKNWASGIMVWNGDWSWIYENFDLKKDTKKYKWEQIYTSNQLKSRKSKVRIINDYLEGWYPFKLMKNRSILPEDAKIVTFCGRPRPHNCNIKWVEEHYR